MFKLTNQFGIFVFAEGTLLSHAKLIRDTITGQHYNPDPTNTAPVKSGEQARAFMRSVNGPASKVPFAFVRSI